MNHLLATLCCAFLFLSHMGFATQLAPWLGKNLELEARASYLLESYQHIATTKGPTKRHVNDSFYTLSLGTSFFDQGAAEMELDLSTTKSHSFNWDCVRLTGRYALLNDILGDPVSLVTGLTVTQASTLGLHDMSSFHHGKIEAEIHAAFGKEHSCESFWTSRWWGLFAVGLADVGSAWLRANVHYEKNWWDTYQGSLFVKTLWGTGHNKLNIDSFHGYGSIGHQAIDLGAKASYIFAFSGTLNIEYSRRLFARNFPKNVNQVKVCFFYPFGL